MTFNFSRFVLRSLSVICGANIEEMYENVINTGGVAYDLKYLDQSQSIDILSNFSYLHKN